MHCYARTLFIVLIAVLGIGNMLTGCGSKGDLYMPNNSQQESSGQPIIAADKE